MDDRRRILVCGDAEGNLGKLYTQVQKLKEKQGEFQLLFAVGAFLPRPPVPGEGAEAAKEAAASFAEYASSKKKAPVETFFVESKSAALVNAAASGKKICENVHFLGSYGVQNIHGFQVAYLSGHYDAKVFDNHVAAPDSPAFVGAAYTPQAIDSLLKIALAPGQPPVDVLLTAEWPLEIEEHLLPAEKPVDPDTQSVKWDEIASPAIATLCAALEPRYHLFGNGNIFYQRAPFQTFKAGHVCRCIGLGKVSSKGKGRTWLHGLSLAPATMMSKASRMQRPENTTPCPFGVKAAKALMAKAGVKRDADDMEGDGEGDGEEAEGEEVPNQVFLSGLPFNIEEKRLKHAFKHCGTIESIDIAREKGTDKCKGFGWVTFSSSEEAQAACELNELLEVGKGRKIFVKISRRKPGQGPRKKREVKIVIEPHAACWFCLVNPNVEKHMIIAVTPQVYLAGARGAIIPEHVMVLPVKHAPCYIACDEKMQEALTSHVQAVRNMCKADGQECLVWERWFPMAMSEANHMQIQIVPIDIKAAGRAREVLAETADKYLAGSSLTPVDSHDDVADLLDDDAGTPYVYFELPGDNTAKGRMIERYVYVQKKDCPRIPVNFGRQVACAMLDCEDKVDWKSCTQSQEVEKELAMAFRDKFKAFKPAVKKE